MSRSRHGRGGFSVSRRQALTAATIGAGLTAGTVVGVASAFDKPIQGPAGADDASVIVVRVRNLAAGTLDVFTGTERFEVRDRELAKKLAKAAHKR